MTTRPRLRPPARPSPPDRSTGWDRFFDGLLAVVLVGIAVAFVAVPSVRVFSLVVLLMGAGLWLYGTVPTMLTTRPGGAFPRMPWEPDRLWGPEPRRLGAPRSR